MTALFSRLSLSWSKRSNVPILEGLQNSERKKEGLQLGRELLLPYTSSILEQS
jgi:hypothetical protein